MRGPHRLPEEGEYFQVDGSDEIFYRFRGSEHGFFGGSIGLIVQARRCEWDEVHETLDEIGKGEQEWVQVDKVRRLFDGREQAEDAAIEQRCRMVGRGDL